MFAVHYQLCSTRQGEGVGKGKRNRAQGTEQRRSSQAAWDAEELALETPYGEWLRTSSEDDLESLLQWQHMASKVPPHIVISERHRAFLPQLDVLAAVAVAEVWE